MTAAIPTEWKVKTLRDLAAINYGRSPAAILAPDGHYPVVGTGGSERLGNAYIHDGESIIFGRKGTIDRVHFVTGKFWTIDTAYYLTGFAESVPKWLFYFLQTLDLRQMNEATGVPSLSRELLYKIKIPAPPKVEQIKIAEILSMVDRAIEQTEALIAKQERMKAGLMQDLLTHGIDEHGTIRSETTHKFKDSPLGRIPVEWEVASLPSKGHPSRAHIKTGPFGSALKSEHWVEFGVPVITIGALGEGQFIDSNLLFVSEKTAQRLASYALVEGDIVFSRVADVGRSVVVTADEFGWIMSSNLMRISLDQKLINPRFSQLCIGYDPRIRMQIRRLVNAGGRDVANSAVMNALAFCWPPKDEQDIIVSRLEAVSVVINIGINNRRKLLSLKTGLMQNLLTGEKRVTPLLQAETPITRETYVKH